MAAQGVTMNAISSDQNMAAPTVAAAMAAIGVMPARTIRANSRALSPWRETPVSVPNAIFTPAKTPQAIVDRLNAALRASLADSAVRKRFEELGSTPADDSEMTGDHVRQLSPSTSLTLRHHPHKKSQPEGWPFCLPFAGRWWAILESNQAWVSPAELQSAAAPCGVQPIFYLIQTIYLNLT